MFCNSLAQAQSQMRVVGQGEVATGYIVANQDNNKDANNRLVGALIIETDISGLNFEADAVRLDQKPGQYILFVSPGQKKVRVLSSNHVPLDIILSEYGIRIKSGEAWKIKITGDKKLTEIPVNFLIIPEDAVLEIAGKKQNAPYRAIPLKEGNLSVKVSKAGFKTQTRTIEVSAKKNLFEFTLEEIIQELQSVTIRSEPKGADFFVDGINKGQTDKGVFLYPNSYDVKWSLSGYVDVQQTLEVKENGKNEFSVKLEKNTGKLSWSVNPSNAKLLINKEDFTNASQAELAPGRYLIELSAEGYDSQSETIELKRGENLRKTWSLEQQTGGLQFMIDPVDAKVSLKRGSQTVETWTGLKILKNLAVGTYQITAEMNGFESKTQTITIQKDKNLPIELKLEKSKVQSSGGKTITNSIGMEFVLIPSGTFKMGSSNGESDEKPIHSVTISEAFYMGKYEVTQKEWKAVMGDNPSRFKGDKLPVEQVSWNDIQEFIKKLNQKEGGTKYRLPTEAEWEYAARAGSNSKWSFGDNESQLGNYAWYGSNSNSQTHPVGQKKPNKYGLYDVHGNVWEWVQDWYDSNYYSSSPKTDSKGPSSGSYRVFRGGSWDYSAVSARSAYRYITGPVSRRGIIGFRLVRLQ